MLQHSAADRAALALTRDRDSSWAIVLAGGQGERMAPFVHQWLGHARPKQYCRFVGEKTMLEHTLERARGLVTGDRVLTVAAEGHQGFLADALPGYTGDVVYQPAARGTAPGIFLPLALIAATATPAAVVHILPSDHFIRSREHFVRHLRLAERIVRADPGRLVLTGAMPNCAETDFGWIAPGRAVSGDGWAALAVRNFQEKPSAASATRYLQSGYLWNTMIVSSTVEALWQLACARLPAMMERFNGLRAALPASGREAAIRGAYAAMPAHDFSKDLIEQSSERCLLLPFKGIAWSDWGRPERIAASAAEFGLQPNFSPALADPAAARVGLAS